MLIHRTLHRFAGCAMRWRRAGLAVAVAFLAGCATLPTGVERTQSRAWDRPEETAIGRALAVALDAHREQSAVRLLQSGVEAFAARVALADAAERTLDLQYYMVRDDDATNALLSYVLAAADRGVRVRMLVDDIHAVGRDFALAAFAGHRNVEIRVFNPFLRRGPLGLGRLAEFLGDSARLNHRMHNKMFVADNAAAVIGGRNLGNEYFGEKADAGFIDLDVLVAGPVVRDASTSFDAYWASEWVVPIEAFRPVRPTAEEVDAVLGSLRDAGRRLRDSEYGERIRASTLFAEVRDGSVDLLWAPATAIADRPDKLLGGSTTESVIRTELRPHLKSAQREVFLVSPYFVPGNDGVATLRELAAKGLRVRVLTNSLAGTDLAAVYAGYSRYQVPLLEAGVELYELRPVGGSADAQERLAEALGAERATLHAKTFVVDGRYVFIGSMNLDPRSDRINTEFGILFDSTALAERLLSSLRWLVEPARSYRLALEDGRVTWTSEQDGRQRRSVDIPDASVGRRLALPLLRALAPESLL